MKKNRLSKILAIGIIVLFIGVGIHPAFAVDIKQSMVNKASVEDCGCNDVSDADLIIVERLLNKVEVYSKLLLVLSRYNAELLEDYEVFSNRISTLTEMNEELKPNKPFEDNPFLCIILYLSFITFGVLSSHFSSKVEEYKDNPILFLIYYSLFILFGELMGITLILLFEYCDSYIINNFHLKVLYTRYLI